MVRILVPILLLFLSLTAGAQNLLTRWEQEKKLSDFEYLVVSAEEEGVIIFRDTDDYDGNKQKWEFKFFDTELEIIQEFEYYVKHDYDLLGYEYNNGQFYVLYQTGLSFDSDWELHQFDFYDGSSKVFNIPNEIEIELSHFLLTGNHLVMGGRVTGKPAVVHYSLTTEKISVLPGFYKKETVLVDMRSNENGTFNVLFLDREVNTGNNQLVFKVFSPGGSLLLESTSTFEEDLRVHSGMSNELEGPDLIITGTYGHKKSKLSRGFYFIKVKPGENNRIVYTDFTKLNEFFRYMGEDREEKIKEKISASTRNKPYEFKTTVVLWKVVEKEDKYAVFAEIIDPQYQVQNTNRRRYTPYGYSTYDMTDYVSDSRYYTSVHSLVNKDIMVSVKYRQSAMILFDRNGKFLSDESHVIKDIETPVLDQSTAYDFQDDSFQMVYKDKEEIIFSMGRGETVHSDSTFVLPTLNDDDDIKFEGRESGKVEHWYGKYYYVWGYQRITNRVSREKRHVFYLSKISLD